ncbi:MAG: hypothetical protein KDC38_20500, partial [Planctomycetes bacterium]|nr:hypothetical protein [Planctomycetota bacterium]
MFGTIGLDAPPVALAADPAGSVWVAASDPGVVGRLYRINRSGATATVVNYDSEDPTALSSDRLGFAWVCLGAAGRVDRVASDGSSIASYAVSQPRAIAIRRRPVNGLTEAWVVGGAAAAPMLHRIRPGEVPEVASFAVPDMVDVTGLTVDGRGVPWISRADGRVQEIDPNVAPAASPLTGLELDIGTDALFLGDATGYRQAAFQYLDGNPAVLSFFDFDGDGFVNRLELDAGSDVFFGGDTPVSPVIPVQGLTCTSDPGSITLVWANAQLYDAIQVFVNGTLQSTLPGTSVSATVTLAPDDSGTFDLAVVAVVGSQMSDPVMCTVLIGTGELLDTAEIVDVDGDLLNPFGISTVFPVPADPEAPHTYVTDPEARLLVAIDANEMVVTAYSLDALGAFDGDFGATGCAYVPPAMTGDPATVYVVGGGNGQPMEIRAIEITDTGTATLGATHLTLLKDSVPLDMGQPGDIVATPTADGLDTILIFAYVGPDGCFLLGILASSTDGEADFGFVHPTPGAGLSGVALTGGFQDFDETGGTIWVTDAIDASEATYQMSELEVTLVPGQFDVVPTLTGYAVPFTELDADNIFG